MDGKPIKLEKGIAAVEGVVLPVDFDQFKTGLVEKIVKPLAGDVDAILTVSVGGIAEGGPVQFERYAVGSHLLNNKKLEPIPAAPGGGAGPAIIETDAPLETIKTETAETKKGKDKGDKPTIAEPTIGENIKFKFADAKVADAALKALGLTPQKVDAPKITDHTALQTIIKTMSRDKTTAGITFKAGGKDFKAFVLEGPGGDFLSNEVSYRVLRLLAEAKSPKKPISFHTHTEQGNVIPADTSTAAARKTRAEEEKKGKTIRDRLVARLTRIIQSVGKIIMGRRSAAKP